MHIAPARTVYDFAAARRLFLAYETLLDIDLSFQNFTRELVAMPGQYVSSRIALHHDASAPTDCSGPNANQDGTSRGLRRTKSLAQVIQPSLLPWHIEPVQQGFARST